MQSTNRWRLFATAIAGTCLTLLSCNLALRLPELTPGPLPSTSPASAAPPAVASVPASPTEGGSATPGQPTAATADSRTNTPSVASPHPIILSASGGRLNVRRGPGPEYDVVGALLNAQSATVTGQNADGTWLFILVPNTSRPYGWITTKTSFTRVTGPAESLPLMTVTAAIPAYIRNCTAHELLVNPGSVTLPDRSTSPDNQLRFYPGEYTVTDQTTDSAVAEVTLLEGRTVDIKLDGSGKKYSCP